MTPAFFLAELVLEHTSDAVVALDAEWRYAYVNHAAELLLRRKRDSLVGKLIWDEYPELCGTPAEDQLRRAAQVGIAVKFEQFLPGLYAWHSVRAIPNNTGMLLFCRDVSERVRALRDEAVRAGIRHVLENVPLCITITRGKEHRIELQNALALKLVGGRNMEGMTLRNALPETEEQGFIKLLDEVYASGKPFEGREMSLRWENPDTADGPMERQFDIIYQPLYETDGQVSGVVHLALDVTEQVNKRQLIARYAAERDATLRQLVEGVILTDAAGRITFVNDAAHQLHGVTALDVVPDDYTATYDLLTEDGAPYPAAELPLARAVLRDEVVSLARWRIRRPDGSVILVEGSAQPVHDAQGKRIAAVLIMRAI